MNFCNKFITYLIFWGRRPAITRVRGGLFVSLMLVSSGLFATNGYFSHGYSVSQKALGGAGTALPEDGLIVTINPAGMVWAGDTMELSLSMFTPIRDYTATERGDGASNGIMSITPGSRRSQNEYFPVPAISYSRMLGNWGSWGISMYGNGGMNTEYIGNSALFGEGLTGFEAECAGSFGGGAVVSGSDNLGFCGNSGRATGVDMAILFLAPSFSMKLGDRSSIGVAPLLAMNRFAAQGLGAFDKFSNAPGKVSNQGHDLAYGAGYRIGVLTGLIPGINLGASYQSRVWMSEFDDYRGVFGESGDFDIPESWNVGIALRISDNQRLVVDFQRINYSSIASVGNPFDPNAFVNNCAIPRLFGSTEPSPDCLGSATGPGFGWRDMKVYKAGYQYTFGGYKFRLGYSRTDQPIPANAALFNVLAPGVVEQHFTAGMSLRWSENMYIETAFMYAPDRPVQGKNPLSNTDANLAGLAAEGVGLGDLTAILGEDSTSAFGEDENDQDLILNMKQFELTISVGWRY